MQRNYLWIIEKITLVKVSGSGVIYMCVCIYYKYIYVYIEYVCINVFWSKRLEKNLTFYFKKPKIVWNNLSQAEGILLRDINPKGKLGCRDFFFSLYCYKPWLAEQKFFQPLLFPYVKVTRSFQFSPLFKTPSFINVFLVIPHECFFCHVVWGVWLGFLKEM